MLRLDIVDANSSILSVYCTKLKATLNTLNGKYLLLITTLLNMQAERIQKYLRAWKYFSEIER